MGQGASQLERSPESTGRANRRRSMLRHSIRHSTIGADDGEDGLLQAGPSGGGRGSISQPRSDSTSRAAGDNSRSALLQRTRSTFQNMMARRESAHVRLGAIPAPIHDRTQPRASYVRPGIPRQSSNDSNPPPRLPSIDHTPPFDDDVFTSRDDPQAGPPRSSSSIRRPNLLFDTLRPSSRSFRQFTSSLRRRRSPQPSSSSSARRAGSEDQATRLSRLLSVAAVATAATLMGDDHQALRESRSLPAGAGATDMAGEDGSFDGFLRALQNGRIASALRQGTDAEGDDEAGDGSLNFVRMFRFGASSNDNSSSQQTRAGSEPGDSSEATGTSDGRMVPIIIVGIRSIPPNSNSSSGSPADDLPLFLEPLGNYPSTLAPRGLGANAHDSIDSILRPVQNPQSFRHRRRASVGGFSMGRSRISDRLDDQRDHRSPDRRRERPWSMASSSYNSEPHAPMPTPASPSPELSRISSRSSTPNPSRPASFVANNIRDFGFSESRRNSVLHRATGPSALSSHTEENGSLHSTHSSTNLLAMNDDAGPAYPHSHRRSDTTPNVHYPRFASGHPRRNGVVEPDHLPPLSRSSSSSGTDNSDANREGRNSNSDSRSWIIYVLGASYPENHPILTVPSLFTDSPTYEDMMLLSALLGPAKPPVASEEEVQSAGGLFNIRAADGSGAETSSRLTTDASKTVQLVAEAVDGIESMALETGQSCLVCLSEFEEKDMSRKLGKCSHLFHQICIDQWLTQGRNSCPLCRGQGVDEKAKPAANDNATVPVEGNWDAVAGTNEDILAAAEAGAI